MGAKRNGRKTAVKYIVHRIGVSKNQSLPAVPVWIGFAMDQPAACKAAVDDGVEVLPGQNLSAGRAKRSSFMTCNAAEEVMAERRSKRGRVLPSNRVSFDEGLIAS